MLASNLVQNLIRAHLHESSVDHAYVLVQTSSSALDATLSVSLLIAFELQLMLKL